MAECRLQAEDKTTCPAKAKEACKESEKKVGFGILEWMLQSCIKKGKLTCAKDETDEACTKRVTLKCENDMFGPKPKPHHDRHWREELERRARHAACMAKNTVECLKTAEDKKTCPAKAKEACKEFEKKKEEKKPVQVGNYAACFMKKMEECRLTTRDNSVCYVQAKKLCKAQ
eukprot:TRINITY_DN6761_c0_g1_i9.p1 TRINITY_DN6761_c0_g1~~TRINITY_DN6761_c0_g1_i9.p1  ORF type:complete len:173 (-),score=32.47 TRINITY_DN6761_c0_g1_i9:22-540(-)